MKSLCSGGLKMAVRGTFENVNLSDNSMDDCAFKEKFYNPISLTGYLTPLQRKKLREKRNVQPNEILDKKEIIDVKKPRNIKRKKDCFSSKSGKEHIKRKKSKEQIPQVQCSAAKIIFKTAKNNVKDKKFFKTSLESRLEKANFTMPLIFKKNVFLNIDKCVKETLCFSRKQLFRKENCEKPFMPVNCADNAEPFRVLSTNILSDKKNSIENSKTVLQTCLLEVSAISSGANCYSENNESFEQISNSEEEKSLFDFDWPSDELLLKRQEKARAIMKERKVLKKSDVSVKQNDIVEEQQSCNAKPMKLYPIFQNAIKKRSKSDQGIIRSPKSVTKRKTEASRGGEQMIIDAGQKEIGAKLCPTCNMIYTIGQEQDEELHRNYHNMYLINLKFPGWKEKNVIGEYGDGRVIMVRKNDKNAKLKKIEDILVIANRDLGFQSSAIPPKPDLTFILFISNTKQVSGCVIAEPISSACQVLLENTENHKDDLGDEKEPIWRIGNWYSGSEPFPAICGINRIWVSHSFRRQKVASRMIDCLRCNFIHGHVIGIRELAFTDPTPDGRVFAAAYTGTDNFLVYK